MNWLAFIPAIGGALALFGTIYTVKIGRKTSQETHATQVFSVISEERHRYIDQLQEDAERHLNRVIELQSQVDLLEKQKLEDKSLIESLRRDLEEVRKLYHECRETSRKLQDNSQSREPRK